MLSAVLLLATLGCGVQSGTTATDSGFATSSSTSTTETTTTTAVQVHAGILRATLVLKSKDSANVPIQTLTYSYVATAAGDFLLSGVNDVGDEAMIDQASFDVSKRIERSYVKSGADGGRGYERTGIAPGAPDAYLSDSLVGRRLASVAKALRAAGDGRVRDVTYEGRPCFELDTPTQTDRLATYSPDRISVIVDEATGLPLRILDTYRGALVRESSLETIGEEESYSAGDYWLPFPSGAEVDQQDEGFRPSSPTESAAVLGYAPVLPVTVPGGFELAQLDVAPTGQPTGKEGMNPPGEKVLSATYRNGFDSFNVSTRLAGRVDWEDPLDVPEGYIAQPEDVVLRSGAFSGASAHLLIDINTIPHLWFVADGRLVTVSGDLSRSDLISVAESLAAVK